MAMDEDYAMPPTLPQHQHQHIKSKSVAPALIAVHPDSACVVVAIGAHLRIFDFTYAPPASPSPCIFQEKDDHELGLLFENEIQEF
jgi:hypothetical protein